jgi:acyl dehydratase
MAHQLLRQPSRRLLSFQDCRNQLLWLRRSTSTDSRSNSVAAADDDGIIITGTIREGGVDIKLGQYARVLRSFSEDDVKAFGRVSGDSNPLHRPWIRHDPSTPPWVSDHVLTRWSNAGPEEGKDSSGALPMQRSRVVVHGMLVSSIFTCILGTWIPGCVYLTQTLDFTRPVYADQRVEGVVTVTRIDPWMATRKGRRGVTDEQEHGPLRLTCDTTVRLAETEKICVRGQAQVLLPSVPTGGSSS